MKLQSIFAAAILMTATTVASADVPNRVTIKGKQYFLNGINVAWNRWNSDLVTYDERAFDEMFANLQSINANAIRWWWFPEGGGWESGIIEANGTYRLDPRVFPALDKAFASAQRHGILIMPSLLSFDVQKGEGLKIVTDPAHTKAFIDGVVLPLVERYDDHPALAIWEIMNEPEWLMQGEGQGTVAPDDLARFHGTIAAAIHRAKPGALVTTGLGMYKHVIAPQQPRPNGAVFGERNLRALCDDDPEARLDVLQVHYYDWMYPFFAPWEKPPAAWVDEGKPILIGEMPAKDAAQYRSLDMHVPSVDLGYAGTFSWAYFNNRSDTTGHWPDAKPGMKAIADKIPEYMAGKPIMK